MSDERDPKVSQRYRELGAEDPPTELDAGILAASRRAVKMRLAPLVPPTGRRRWYFPVAAAAIITLAVAVTVHMEQQQLDPEFYGLRSGPPEAKKDSAPQAELRKAKPAKPPAASAPAPAPRAADAMQQGASAEVRRESGAPARLLGQVAKAESPEAALERVAELRRQGRHDEADKALAEFRRRYPDYRIAEEMLKKVERP